MKKNKFNIFSLKGKKILIIGGSGKLGLRFAKTLKNAGGQIILADVNKPKNNQYAFYYCDVSNQSNVADFASKLFKKEKKIDVLIYNVYSKPKNYYKPYEDYEYETWNNSVNSNLNGAFLISQILIKHFKSKKIKGNIIFLSSTYGIVGPDMSIYKGLSKKHNIYGGKFSLTTPAVYSATKSGLIGLSRWISTSYGKYNIRSNILSPGGVFDNQEKKFVKNYTSKVPLNRMAKWKDYDGAILFLSSDASSYMTGSNLVIDGGWTAW